MASKDTLLKLYEYMLASRESDNVEAELVNSGEANFLASSKGHEGSAILAPFLQPSDWLHCHYRDKALMLARGVSNEMFFYSALTKAESHSNGRQMVSHMSAPELNILSLVGPIGNSALQAAGIAHTIKDQQDNPLVLCAIGDGTSQQGEVLEAIAETKRSNLPVLFMIHNNDLAISTRTAGKTFFSLPDGSNPEKFYDVTITHIDGKNVFTQYDKLAQVVKNIRNDRQPQIVIFNVDRLDNHSNADDQKLYRTDDELKINQDPVLLAHSYLLSSGSTEQELEQIKLKVRTKVRAALEIARQGTTPKAYMNAEKPLIQELCPDALEYRGDINASERYSMLEAMREVFNQQLADGKVYLLGEDIEDGKGDVFGITRGLSTKYPKQVKNSVLSESTIVGLAGGMALAGKKPVAFIQFADFMPLAYNQIFTELSTMYWRTNGGWQCPVIVFAACGAYSPGLGPFHSQTNEATYAHIPGLDVYMPSNAADAAGMLNAAFKSGRPSMFLYPKKLLNAAGELATTSRDIHKHLVPISKARIVKPGSDITLVGWGNTMTLCQQVSNSLETVGIDAEIIDLRTIKPYDLKTILASAEKTGRLLVTHEDNLTCGVGGDIIASVIEAAKLPIKVRRVTRSDTYTPCNFVNQLEVLPSYEKILIAAAELLDLELTWNIEQPKDESLYNVEVIGASPSDESVLINEVAVKVGEAVKSGDKLVDIEASKAAGEILAPVAGIIEQITVVEGERALVGNTLLVIRLPHGIAKAARTIKKQAILTRKIKTVDVNNSEVSEKGVYPVGLGLSYYKTGSRKVTNNDLLTNFSDFNSSDITQRTGIESRYWLESGETIIDIAAKIVEETLKANNLQLSDINQIICATCTPEKYQSPAMACLILEKLYNTYSEQHIPAYDLNAACSGFLYALQNAKDYLQTRPNQRVLIITAENLSKRMNLKDFDTAFLFGDAATTTIISGNDYIKESKAIINEIYLTAIAENGEILNIPTDETQGIQLQGKKLFAVAVKTMSMVMHKCCQMANFELANIDLVIPHQANQRISNAIEKRLNMRPGVMFSNITNYGNTSSCTIPLGLAQSLSTRSVDEKVALCAFGSGFTAGAALLTVIN